MRVGIVGAEGAKFTHRTEQRARAAIRNIIRSNNTSLVVSGKCPLGGIDIWAVEEAYALNVLYQEFQPLVNNWEEGFMPRNKRIAENSDIVVCIAVRELPPGYQGRRFNLCYHDGRTDHVKSGGCWTVKYAQSLGKPGQLVII